MKTKSIILFSLIILVTTGSGVAAKDQGLGSRKFKYLTPVVYDVPTDCSSYIHEEETLSYMGEYLENAMGPFVNLVQKNDTPRLSVKVDCMHLVDARGDGRSVGHSISILVQFYRPFYEDITYVNAATWTHSQLLYVPAERFSQAYFNEQLEFALEEFAHLWLDEHNEIINTDNLR